jgi:hypothetical protein
MTDQLDTIVDSAVALGVAGAAFETARGFAAEPRDRGGLVEHARREGYELVEERRGGEVLVFERRRGGGDFGLGGGL